MTHVEKNNFRRVPNIIRALLHVLSVQELQKQEQWNFSWIKKRTQYSKFILLRLSACSAFYLGEITWTANIILIGHSYVHDTTWHWNNEKCKFVSSLPHRKDSLRGKIMLIPFWCFIPSKFVSAIPLLPVEPYNPAGSPKVFLSVCPLSFIFIVPVPHISLLSQTFLTKTSMWALLHKDVEGEIPGIFVLPQLLSCIARQLHADFLSTKTFKMSPHPWLQLSPSLSESPPLAVTHGRCVPTMKKKTLDKYSSRWPWVRFTSFSKRSVGSYL